MSELNVVMTGGTGFVGRHWIHRLLAGDPGTRVTALVRGQEGQAEARLRSLVQSVGPDYSEALAATAFERLDVVPGDVQHPACGVSEGVRARLGGQVSQFWHLAATTDFRAERRDAIHALNVTATGHALALAHELGAQDFFHVSTAYVCGRKQGLIPEAAYEPDAGFNNPYEESKHASERLVFAECERRGMRAHVLRPSIIVAPRSTLAARGASHGLYGFLRGVYATRAALRGGPALRVRGNPAARLNLIGVDDAVGQMLSGYREPETVGLVRHVVSDGDVTAAEVMAAVCGAVGVAPFQLEVDPFRGPSPLELAFEREIGVYAAYLNGVRGFERRSRESSVFGASELGACCASWVADRVAYDPLPAAPHGATARAAL